MAILHHRAAEGQLVLAPAAGSVVLGYIRAAMDAASQRIPQVLLWEVRRAWKPTCLLGSSVFRAHAGMLFRIEHWSIRTCGAVNLL
jgi:hypothetical protein